MDLTSKRIIALSLTVLLTAAGCNPVTSSNPPTGNAIGTLAGGGIGAAVTAGAGVTPSYVVAGGMIGAGIGYYVSSIRFAGAGVTHNGGHVYTVGQLATIEIPTDQLFDTNSSDLLPGSDVILDSVVKVLGRYPSNNIMISGNMSGFGTHRYEQKLSEARARQVAAYLWSHGVSLYQGALLQNRKLIYVGYGSYFPVANNIHLDSIRSNSRIQITAYPSDYQIHLGKKFKQFNNIGNLQDDSKAPPARYHNDTFTADHMSDGSYLEPDTLTETASAPKPETEDHDYTQEIKGEFSDAPVENHNTLTSASQTLSGPSPMKQEGYKGEGGFKGESDFKDMSPPPAPANSDTSFTNGELP